MVSWFQIKIEKHWLINGENFGCFKNYLLDIYYLLHRWILLTLTKNLFKKIANERILLNLLLKTYSILT